MVLVRSQSLFGRVRAEKEGAVLVNHVVVDHLPVDLHIDGCGEQGAGEVL